MTDTRELVLLLEQDALDALEELAAATGREGQNRRALLIQDALRTFEWLVGQQKAGRNIVSLDLEAMKVLAANVEPSEVVRLADLS